MSRPPRIETIPVRIESDMVVVRLMVREASAELGFNLLELTKMVTAASELGRNTLLHGGGGTMRLEILSEKNRDGLRLTFDDQGPGIANLEQAMVNGFTTKWGLGLGLGGSKRLVDEFKVTSQPGRGTSVTVTRWK
jgi:serine/threonine-protein kinase RsbT